MRSLVTVPVLLSLTLSACVPPAAAPPPGSPAAPPAPSPALEKGPIVIAPTAMETMRVAGEKSIVPDDATRSQLAADGVAKVVTSYKICLGTDGVPELVQLVSSSGYPAYDAKLQAGMKQWRYRPYTVDGVAKKVCTGVTFVYRQENDPRDRKPQILVYTPAQAKLTMRSAGSGPAAPLRLTPVRGRKQYVRMTYGEGVVVAMAGQSPKDFGGLTLSLDAITEATAVDERGALRYVTTIEKSELVRGADTTRNSLSGATLEGAASTLGATSRTQLHPPPNRFVADGMDFAHKALSTWLILPRDPVAVGAQWEVTSQEALLDTEANVVTLYTLQARTATTATISGEIKILSIKQPSGGRQILAVTGYGKLEATLTEGRLYPQLERALHVEVKSRERLGSDHPVDVDTDYTLDVRHGFSPPWPQPTP